MRGLLRALLRQLTSRVSIQPADPAPVSWHPPGRLFVPQTASARRRPGALPAVFAAHAVRIQLPNLLHIACCLRADVPQTAAEVVPLVASLVELERQVYHSREVIQGEAVGPAAAEAPAAVARSARVLPV